MHEPFAGPDGLGIELVHHAPLADFSTFRLGGPCRTLIHCRIPAQLQAVVGALAEQGLDFILLGGGSNILVSDEGVDAVVLRYVNPELEVSRSG
ncbi:MAG: hypothetical protein AAF492_26735, partial [Verrucomicrobiota bacterium]